MSAPNSAPLAVAMAAKHPIDDAPRVPLEVERLLSGEQRRITPAVHQAFRESIATPTRHFDEIDEAMGDPLVERYGMPVKESKASRLLSILDELDRREE